MIRALSRPLACVLFVAALAALPSCKPAMIPGTEVEDTKENRRVIEVLAKYRDAVVRRDAPAIVALCAPSYFEDMGTVDQADDYGYSQLRERLETHLAHAKEIQLQIIVQKIEPQADDKRISVAYRYNERALLTLPAGDKWVSVSDVNRVVLQQDGDNFSIVSGL